MANEEQLAILRQGVDAWNKWRQEDISRKIDLSGADLRNRQLSEVNLVEADLSGADLTGANFVRAYLVDANLSRADLKAADFDGATLMDAILTESCLRETDLRDSDLSYADLSHSNMVGAYLVSANLYGANLSHADLYDSDLDDADLGTANLTNANLNRARLNHTSLRNADIRGADLRETELTGALFVGTKVDKAKISGSSIYGISVWDLDGQFDEQKDLIVTSEEDSAITVDDVEVAQFIYLLINNQKVRNVIDIVTTKVVLILGRFYEERKEVLDALKDALRERGFVPILFDFEPSKERDLTETVQLLANMAKFVIADITDAKSIPQELSHIIPFLPSVPIQPILLISKEKEYAMFEHWRSFNTVLPEFLYLDKQDLLDNLEAKIMKPIDAWRKGQNEVSILQNRIKELEAKISDSK